jgi:hypothetical protein
MQISYPMMVNDLLHSEPATDGDLAAEPGGDPL